jgi:hypothetical protein
MDISSVTAGSTADAPVRVVCDHTGLMERLPGSRFKKLLLWHCVRVAQLAAGGRAELRLGYPREHDRASDRGEVEPLVNALAKLTGRSDDECWSYLSGRVEALLWNETFWSAVVGVAHMLESGATDERRLGQAIRLRLFAPGIPSMAAELETLGRFVDTPAARQLGSSGGFLRSLGGFGDDGFSG